MVNTHIISNSLIRGQLYNTVQAVNADAMMGFRIKIHTMQLVLPELTLNN
jgi:hypothetical protein